MVWTVKIYHVSLRKYLVDIACLQEMKIKNGVNNENITCFPNKEDAYGLGFIVN